MIIKLLRIIKIWYINYFLYCFSGKINLQRSFDVFASCIYAIWTKYTYLQLLSKKAIGKFLSIAF